MEKQQALRQQSPRTYTGYYNYELAAFPAAVVLNTVLDEKLDFRSQYGEKVTTTTNPQITVAKFKAKEEMEETLIRYMHRIFYQHQSFTVELNNYSGIPPHTIYLRVQNHHPFKVLAKELLVLDHYLHAGNDPSMIFPQIPRINIASNLPEYIYNKAMAEYSQRSFHQSFTVCELVLLKTNPPFNSYQTINIFKLQ